MAVAPPSSLVTNSYSRRADFGTSGAPDTHVEGRVDPTFGTHHVRVRARAQVEQFGDPRTLLMLGREPFRIDLLTNIPAVEFDEAWRERSFVEFDGVTVPVISKRHLIVNKRSVGRLQDLADAEALEKLDG